MKRPSVRTLDRKRKTVSNLIRLELDSFALSELIAGRGAILPTLPNAHDNLVVQELSTASLAGLPVDQFGRLLCSDGELFEDKHIIALRLALIGVYFRTANARLNSRATNAQIKSARSAFSSLTKAIKHLDDVGPPRQRGLQAIFGSPLDDPKGIDESNEFHSKCLQLKLDVVPVAMRLEQTIRGEHQKSKSAGERKKRLRILMETLADWWKSVTGKSVVPYVYAKRLDNHPAMVIDRRGGFVDLARALFCKLDEFRDSEVVSAITNVHESDLAKRKSRRAKN